MTRPDPPRELSPQEAHERLERDHLNDDLYWAEQDRQDRHAPAPDFTVGLARTRLRESISALFSLALQSEMAGRQEHADQLCGEAEALKRVLAAWETEGGGFE